MKKFIIIVFLVLAGCNSTKMSGVVDPNYAGKFKSKKMIVMGSGMTIEEQKVLESSINKSFAKYQVEMVSSLQLFPLTRTYSEDDYYKAAIKNNVDSILVVNVDGRGVNKTYVPPSYTSYGITGGYTIEQPVINFTLKLVDTKNKENIWIAQGTSTGDGTFLTLTSCIAKTSSVELFKAGLIIQKKV